jgi:hypothetical protein
LYGASFYRNITRFGLLGPYPCGGFRSYLSPVNRIRCFLEDFLARQFERLIFHRSILNSLYRFADRAFADGVFRSDAFIVRYSRKYFRAMYRLSSTDCLGALPPCRCSLSNYFWSIDFIISHGSGFTPNRRLNTLSLAPCAFFPVPFGRLSNKSSK